MKSDLPTKALLNMTSAAAYLGVSRSTLYRLITRGEIIPVIIPSTSLQRIRVSDLEKLVAHTRSE